LLIVARCVLVVLALEETPEIIRQTSLRHAPKRPLTVGGGDAASDRLREPSVDGLLGVQHALLNPDLDRGGVVLIRLPDVAAAGDDANGFAIE
jgi:hypothetical protein